MYRFKAWGAEIDGVEGRVGAPLQTRQQLWRLVAMIVKTGWASKAVLQRVCGFEALALQFRRELFALLHRGMFSSTAWTCIAGAAGHILDQLRSVRYHLPLASWHMRRAASRSFLATDATPTSGGVALDPIEEPTEVSQFASTVAEALESGVKLFFLADQPHKPAGCESPWTGSSKARKPLLCWRPDPAVFE